MQGIHQALLMSGAVAVPPLLDALSVGPKAAFSTRKLRAAYSGSALRVRRSNDNTEQDIGFSGNDLDTAALASFVGSNSGYVVTWYDQSTNAANATNATTTKQPRIVNAGTNHTQNSKVCTVAASAISLPFSVSVTGDKVTAIAIASLTSGGTSIRLLTLATGGTDGSTDNRYTTALSQDGSGAQIMTYRNFAVKGSRGVTYDVAFNATTIFDGANDTLYIDNVAATPGGSSGNFAITTGYIGSDPPGAQNWVGKICEMVVFDTNLGSTDRGAAYSNQKAYWGTP